MKIFISSDNVHQLSKVQSAKSYGSDRDVVLLWDELTKKQRNIAENIDIDLEVHTSEPSSVPDKWSDSIKVVGEDTDNIEMVKYLISNPNREDVYEMLQDEDPPEPLMLWWLSHTIRDHDFMKDLADVCHYGLFKADTDYLWGVVAFGVDGGVGKFGWPNSSKDRSKSEQELFDEAVEELDIPEKELDILWDDVKGEVRAWISGESDEGDQASPDESSRDNQSSLLDL